MDEFKFVLRCLAFSIFLLVLTQVKTNDVSLEARIQGALINSQVSDFVNKVSQGGVKLIKNASDYTVEHYNTWKQSGKTQINHQMTKIEFKPMVIKTEPKPTLQQAAVAPQQQPNTENVEAVEDFE